MAPNTWTARDYKHVCCTTRSKEHKKRHTQQNKHPTGYKKEILIHWISLKIDEQTRSNSGFKISTCCDNLVPP